MQWKNFLNLFWIVLSKQNRSRAKRKQKTHPTHVLQKKSPLESIVYNLCSTGKSKASGKGEQKYYIS